MKRCDSDLYLYILYNPPTRVSDGAELHYVVSVQSQSWNKEACSFALLLESTYTNPAAGV